MLLLFFLSLTISEHNVSRILWFLTAVRYVSRVPLEIVFSIAQMILGDLYLVKAKAVCPDFLEIKLIYKAY